MAKGAGLTGAVFALLLVGCEVPVHVYEGPERSPAEVAILVASGTTTILAIDDVATPRMEQVFAVLPGHHKVFFRGHEVFHGLGGRETVGSGLHGGRTNLHCRVEAVFRAGRRYVVWMTGATGTADNARYFETEMGMRDETSGEELPGVDCYWDSDPRELYE